MKLIQAILLVPFTFLTPLISKAKAQSITSAPDGVGTIINHNGNTYNITGGTISGANLFHSFAEFGLSPQEVANFLSNPNIQNVLGRVTGGNPSVVEGLIKLTGGNSNLYLMNPSGWVFGQGASLDVPGSFAATTATRIGFGDSFFNALGDNDFSKLTGSPTSFVFDSQTGLIINEGNLEVGTGESLWLVGNSVISTGTLEAPGGNVTIAAIPEKKQIRISQEGMALELVLDAAPLSTGNYADNIGLKAVDIPRYLSGGNETGHADTVTVGADGKIYLTGGTTFTDGDVAIAGEVKAQDVTLMAANQVTPTNPDLIFTHDGKHSAPTVVLFPGEGDGLGYTFIDSTVEDYQSLLYGGVKGTVSFVVTPDEDGIAFVGDKLEALGEQNRTIDTLTILTEGSGGNFWLGKAFVSHENLALYEAQLQRWQAGLGVNADLLLYSCFAALGINGEALVNGLATLTTADVAASTNLTGSSEWGADWDLEYETGTIEAGVPFEGDVLEDYDHTLQLFTVTNGGDTGVGSLRQAITDANNATTDAFDEIRFASGITQVTLTSGQLDIDVSTNGLIINGDFNGASNVVVERSAAGGTPDFRIFEITGDNNITFDALTIRNGRAATSSGGGIDHQGTGTVTLTNSTVSGNEALFGGGIRSRGGVTLTNSIVSGNEAEASGGGISSFGGVTLTNSTVSNNEAQYVGGGIRSRGTVSLTNSTVSGNEADFGGGILSDGGVNLTNSTVNDNEAGRYDGGGILSDGGVNLTNSTVSGNEAGRDGGGIFSLGGVNLTNSTVSDNEAGRYDGGIFGSVSVALTNSTVSGNEAQINAGGILSFGGVTLTSSTVSGNEAGGFGGGIFSFGGVNLTNSTVSGNETGTFGSGILSRGGVNLTNSTVSGNEAGTFGSGIYSRGGAVTLTNSTVSGNEAGTFGGGIYSSGAVTLTNSTVSSNEAGIYGGGIYSSGAVTLTNSTVSGNEAILGGGIYISETQNNTINNSIIANNQSAIAPGISGDLSTSIVEFSLIEDTTGITGQTLTDGVDGNIIGKDPLLLALGNYGASNQTHALSPNSPALDAGSDALAVDQTMAALTTDQRGAARFNGTVDMGAFEAQGYTFSLIAGDNQSTNVNTAFPTNLAVKITENFANSPLPGVTITFTPTPGTTGASGSFAGGTAITDASGIATANILTANAVTGGFTVSATASSISSGTFNLTNIPNQDLTALDEVTELNNLGASQGICEIPEVNIDDGTTEVEEEEEEKSLNTVCQSPSGATFSHPNSPVQ